MGQTETLSHLAPFVDISRQKIKGQVIEELASVKDKFTDDEYNDLLFRIVEERLRDEVKKGVQTMQYQINTLLTSNG